MRAGNFTKRLIRFQEWLAKTVIVVSITVMVLRLFVEFVRAFTKQPPARADRADELSVPE